MDYLSDLRTQFSRWALDAWSAGLGWFAGLEWWTQAGLVVAGLLLPLWLIALRKSLALPLLQVVAAPILVIEVLVAALFGYPLSRVRGRQRPRVLGVFALQVGAPLRKAGAWVQGRVSAGGFQIAFMLYAIAATVGAGFIFFELFGAVLEGPQSGATLEYRLALATLLGALGLPLLLHKARINERQTKTAEDGHVTERIIKATELLGATKEKIAREEGREQREIKPNVEVRIGSIYTLERVARDSLDDHVTIMETLAAYIRQNYKPKEAPAAEAERGADPKIAAALGLQSESTAPEKADAEAARKFVVIRPREDVLAAIRVILRRGKKQVAREAKDKKPFRWQDVPLGYADLKELFTASGPDDRPWALPSARLEGADLRGAKLERAYLGGAELGGASLVGVSSLDLTRLAARINNGERSEPGETGGLSKEQKAAILEVLARTFADAQLAQQVRDELGVEPPAHWSKDVLLDAVKADRAWRQWRKEQGYE